MKRDTNTGMFTARIVSEYEQTPPGLETVRCFLRCLGCCLFLLFAVLVMSLWTIRHVQAATISVNTTDDSPSETLCSLRQAIRAANTNQAVGGCTAGDIGVDTIVLPTGLYTLTVSGPNENDAHTGDLDIHEELVINGADRATTVIDGAKLDRIFEIMPGVAVTITSLTIQNGLVVPNDDADPSVASGGAIYNAGLLTLRATDLISNSAFYSKTTTSMGGALYSDAPLDLTDVLFQNNQAQVGGAVYTVNTQSAISNSRFLDNRAEKGGALYLDVQSVTTISASQILSNTAIANHYVGGGIVNAGILTATDVLIAHNSAFLSSETPDPDYSYGEGGGIANLKQATLTILRSTIANNAVWGIYSYPNNNGGGIYNAGSLSVQQSHIVGNGASSDGGGVYGGGIFQEVAIERNGAGARGGGLYGLGDLTNVTISYNIIHEIGFGAGGYGCGRLRNVTISNNYIGEYGYGGGIAFDADKEVTRLFGNCLTLQQVSIISNSAAVGAGLYFMSSFIDFSMENTVIVQNEGGKNCRLSDTTIQSLGGNYVDDLSCAVTAPTDRQGDLPDPRLGPLADNGGMTQSHMPQDGSPLIDSGNCNGAIMTDQRDAPRPQGYRCDIGAVEAPGPFLRFLPNVSK